MNGQRGAPTAMRLDFPSFSRFTGVCLWMRKIARFLRLPLLPVSSFCLLAWLAAPAALAIDLSQRSISGNKQFTVYCPDAELRLRVASFAAEVKAETLALLGESDRWKHPIVLTLDRAADGAQPMAFGLYATEVGFKVQIDVRIGAGDLAEVNLRKQLVRALFLEFAYREKPELVRGGMAYREAPWWLLEGALELFQRRDRGADADLFKTIIAANRLPPIEQFLVEKPQEFGSTAQAMDRACAMCLVQLLLEQTRGRANLANLLRHLPDGSDDPVAALVRDFPALTDGQSLQKWWTLSLARFAAADRYKGLSAEETDAELASLLVFEVPGAQPGEKKIVGIDAFAELVKKPASRAAFIAGQASLVALSARANVLFRSVIADYERIFASLARGKTRGIKDQLAKAERYRELVLRRKQDIADYMNWFEATQMEVRSDAFEGYLKVANELAAPVKRNDPVTEYLDEVEREMAR